jgi:hypothetical protein
MKKKLLSRITDRLLNLRLGTPVTQLRRGLGSERSGWTVCCPAARPIEVRVLTMVKLGQPLHRLLNTVLVYDVVSLEDSASLVTADLHGDRLGHAGATERSA